MSAQRRPAVLLVTNDRPAAGSLAARCRESGIEAVLAADVEELRTAMGPGRPFDVVMLDLRVKPESAKKIYDFVLSKVTGRTRVFTSNATFDTQTLEELEMSGKVTRLDVPLADADDVIRRAIGSAMPAKYDINLINCFVTSVDEVLEYYVGEKPVHEKVQVSVKKTTPPGFVTALVKFDGKNVAGATAFTCDRSLLVAISSRINGTSKKQSSEDRAAMVAAAEEMADQIFGKAELLLGRVGYPVRMGAPEIHVGETQEIVIEAPAPFVILPFIVARKRLYVGFSLYRK